MSAATNHETGAPSSAPRRIRSLHRWLSITFTVAVIANFAVMGNEAVGQVVGALTLLPLALLLFSGLYLFALPYLHRRGR